MNTLTQRTPMERVAENILHFYAQHPDLIHALLARMGAYKLTMRRGQIRCTCPLHRGNNPQAFAVWFDKGIPYWRCHTDCQIKGSLTKLDDEEVWRDV
jgi:hypothetical protein